MPYSPEYRAAGADRGLLRELARRTGGGELAEPAAAFAHTLPVAARGQVIWPSLLLAAALLFPLDVAVRRLTLGPQDVRKAVAWLRLRWPFRRTAATRPERALGRLFQARARARRRHTRGEGPPPLPETPRKYRERPRSAALRPMRLRRASADPLPGRGPGPPARSQIPSAARALVPGWRPLSATTHFSTTTGR